MKNRKDLMDAIVVTSNDKSPRLKTFSVRRLITYNLEEYGSRGMLVLDSSEDLSEGLALAKLLFEIEGIEYVAIKQYDIWVRIGRAFHWKLDCIELAVFAKIKGYLRTYLNALKMMDDADNAVNGKLKKKPKLEE